MYSNGHFLNLFFFSDFDGFAGGDLGYLNLTPQRLHCHNGPNELEKYCIISV